MSRVNASLLILVVACLLSCAGGRKPPQPLPESSDPTPGPLPITKELPKPLPETKPAPKPVLEERPQPWTISRRPSWVGPIIDNPDLDAGVASVEKFLWSKLNDGLFLSVWVRPNVIKADAGKWNKYATPKGRQSLLKGIAAYFVAKGFGEETEVVDIRSGLRLAIHPDPDLKADPEPEPKPEPKPSPAATEEGRKRIFWEHVAANHQAALDADAKFKVNSSSSATPAENRAWLAVRTQWTAFRVKREQELFAGLREKYGISQSQINEIAGQGAKANWPRPTRDDVVAGKEAP